MICSRFICSTTTIAVRSFVILAIGKGSVTFCARTILLVEQSMQNIAFARTGGLEKSRTGEFTGTKERLDFRV